MKLFALLLTVLVTTSPAAVGADTVWLRIGTARPTSAPPYNCDAPTPDLCPPPIKSGFEPGGEDDE